MIATSLANRVRAGVSSEGNRVVHVVLAAGNRLAGQAVRAALEAIPGISLIGEAPSDDLATVASTRADLVIVDLTLSSLVEPQLRDLSLQWPGAVMVSIELRHADQYGWVRARPIGPWFAVDAFGAGTIDQLVRAATTGNGPGVFAPEQGMTTA
jgi:hypothetical protein